MCPKCRTYNITNQNKKHFILKFHTNIFIHNPNSKDRKQIDRELSTNIKTTYIMSTEIICRLSKN